MSCIVWQQWPGGVCAAGAERRVPACALGGSMGEFIHSSCPESWAAAPSPWHPPGLCSWWSSQENAAPHYCTDCWGHFEMGLTLQKGPCTAFNEHECERKRRWLLAGTFPAALCPTLPGDGINGVFSQSQTEQPRTERPRHPPTVPVPPAGQHLPTSQQDCGQNTTKALVWWEVFLWVNFLGTWTMWYVCLFVK